MLRLLFLSLVVLSCALSALAQSRAAIGSAPHLAGHAPGPGFRRSTVVIGGTPFRRPFRGSSPFYYGLPYWGYYEPYEPEYPPQEQAAPQPAPAPAAKNEPLPDPVLLELEGNHWVRVTSFGETGEPAARLETSRGAEPETKATPVPPAVLVYLDGHSEEVSSYSIIGQALYAKADYWKTGSWIRMVQIADLDIPATLRQNQERGVRFELPSGPDEVVIRP